MTVSLQQNEAAPFVKAAWAQFGKPLENLAFDRDFVLGVELKNLPETVHPIVILRKKMQLHPIRRILWVDVSNFQEILHPIETSLDSRSFCQKGATAPLSGMPGVEEKILTETLHPI